MTGTNDGQREQCLDYTVDTLKRSKQASAIFYRSSRFKLLSIGLRDFSNSSQTVQESNACDDRIFKVGDSRAITLRSYPTS